MASILLHTEIRSLQKIKSYTVKDILAMIFFCAMVGAPSENILNFENLFAPTEGAACEPLVSKFAAKYTADQYFLRFTFLVGLRSVSLFSSYSQIKCY